MAIAETTATLGSIDNSLGTMCRRCMYLLGYDDMLIVAAQMVFCAGRGQWFNSPALLKRTTLSTNVNPHFEVHITHNQASNHNKCFSMGEKVIETCTF